MRKEKDRRKEDYLCAATCYDPGPSIRPWLTPKIGVHWTLGGGANSQVGQADAAMRVS